MPAKEKRESAYLDKEEYQKSIEVDYVLAVPEKKVSGWLRIIFWGFFLMLVASDLFPSTDTAATVETLSMVEIVLVAIFAVIFSEACAYMASKINRNMDFAWGIGFLFGLLGAIVYGIYFVIIRAREPKTAAKPAGKSAKKEPAPAVKRKNARKR